MQQCSVTPQNACSIIVKPLGTSNEYFELKKVGRPKLKQLASNDAHICPAI